jgi:hypothetical protein
VYMSEFLSVRMSARCHWSTVFYLRKGSKTPEATSDLARKNDKKVDITRGGRGCDRTGGLRVDTHTSRNVGDGRGRIFPLAISMSSIKCLGECWV